jgi:glycosyltransferase involved in cell wall biosynthesis
MISIIIPVYNHAKELDSCLNSIKNQTYKNYEVVVVDDASRDGVKKIIHKYRSKFGISFNFYENSENKGAPFTRNRGFRKSKGEYVLFCDADLILRPNMLEEMYSKLKEKPEASYVYSSFFWGKKKFKLFDFDAEKLRQMPYIHSSSLIRREHFPKSGWDERIKRLQDWDLWLTMLNEKHAGVWIDQTLFRVVNIRGTMSGWMPSVVYKIFPFLPKVAKYNNAIRIVQEKHGIIKKV